MLGGSFLPRNAFDYLTEPGSAALPGNCVRRAKASSSPEGSLLLRRACAFATAALHLIPHRCTKYLSP